MPRTPPPPHILEFLRKPNPAVIASSRPDGQPVSVATWYLLEDDGRILVNMEVGRRRLHYLRHDPRAGERLDHHRILARLADQGVGRELAQH